MAYILLLQLCAIGGLSASSAALSQKLLAFLLFSVLIRALITIYRLYFHPLRKFPGPKLAAATTLYEFYFAVIHDGLFLWEVEKLHQKYGPIVRITPGELHIKDSSFYNEIYASHPRRRDKYPQSIKSVGMPSSALATIDHDLHRNRRKTLAPHFSKQTISNLQPLITDKVDTLTDRLTQSFRQDPDRVINLDHTLSAMSADIISCHSYGFDFGFLSHPDYRNDFRECFQALTTTGNLIRWWPFKIEYLTGLPTGLVRRFNPKVAQIGELRSGIYNRVLSRRQTDAKDKDQQEDGALFSALTHPSVPAAERTPDRLMDELFVLMAAGSDTTARALAVTMYYLLEKPEITMTLRAELNKHLPAATTRPFLADLEAVPFLRAVIYEGLRLSFGGISRFVRVAPDEALKYENWTIPPGTGLSQITYFVNTDPAIFPDPFTFNPGRFIEAWERGVYLENSVVSFIKGNRACLGMNLALAEMHLVVAALACRFEFELHDTSRDDVEPYRDRLVPIPRNGDRGIRVKVTGVIQNP